MDPLTILLANRNTLDFLPLCLGSIRKNLTGADHRIIILDDASSDGSVDWLEAHREEFRYDLIRHQGPERLGIVHAYNVLVQAAATPAVWLVHTDMYMAPGADVETARWLQPGTICTCTRIEPPLYPGQPYKIVSDLGTEPATFREAEFLRLAAEKSEPGRTSAGIFAPVMCYREDYLAVGGLDPAFAPQSREDSDLFNRMAIAGYRFRQSWSAFCYHFSGRGSRKKDGIAQDSEEWKRSNRKNELNFIRRYGCSVRHGELLEPQIQPKESITIVGLLGSEETDNVRPYLEHLEPFADDILLLADGPQPEAQREVAAYIAADHAMGPSLLTADRIRIIERPLANDFAAQRNAAHHLSQSDWILHVDLDERLDRGLLEQLQSLVLTLRREGKTVCGFPRLNTLDGVLVNDLPRQQWTPDGLAAATPTDSPSNLDPQFRLLRRDVRWRRRVHEVPEPLIEKSDSVTLWTHAAIRHPKSLDRQHRQDARYERIATGASLAGAPAAPTVRILILATEFPPAAGFGLARYSAELAQALVEAGAQVHVVTNNQDTNRGRYEQHGVTVHQATELPGLEHYAWESEAVLGNLWLIQRALEVIRQDCPFTAVISHDWIGSLAAKTISSSTGIPWLLIMHDTEHGKRAGSLTPAQQYIAEMETWSCAHAGAIITTTDHLAHELHSRCDAPSHRIRVIPCGVRPERFITYAHLPDYRALFAGPQEQIILFVGRLSPVKGVDLLIDAMPLILRQRPDTRLLIAGDGVLRETLAQRCDQLGIVDRVQFLGHLPDKVLATTYRIADVVAMPSRYEPFGMVALEAMASGTPLVASGVGGLGSLLPKNPLVQRVDALDSKTWATALVRQLSTTGTPEHRQNLTNWTQRFAWPTIAHEVLKTVNALASHSSPTLPLLATAQGSHS